jgi:hypothetical protein
VGGLRYFAGAVAFGFAAVWIMASLAAALVCLLSAVAGYGAARVVETARAKLAGRASRPSVAVSNTLVPTRPALKLEDMPSWAEALNSDLGHVYEPSATTSPLAREADYGWPLIDDTVIASEPLH